MCKSGEEGEPSFPRLRNATLVKAEPGPILARRWKASKSMNAWRHQVIVEVINNAWKTWMKYSANRSTCMWVRQFIGWVNVRAKQFHACDNSEIATKTETELEEASIHVNNSKCSKKSSKQYSYKWKRKKRHKWNTRHGNQAYPKKNWAECIDCS